MKLPTKQWTLHMSTNSCMVKFQTNFTASPEVRKHGWSWWLTWLWNDADGGSVSDEGWCGHPVSVWVALSVLIRPGAKPHWGVPAARTLHVHQLTMIKQKHRICTERWGVGWGGESETERYTHNTYLHHTHTHTHTRTHTHTHTHIKHTHTFSYNLSHVVNSSKRINIHTHVHTNTHIHMHTQIPIHSTPSLLLTQLQSPSKGNRILTIKSQIYV